MSRKRLSSHNSGDLCEMGIFEAFNDFIADVVNFFIALLDDFLGFFGIDI